MAESAPAAFVTGGSRGIGAETAVSLAAKGYDVAIGYRDPKKRKRAEEIEQRMSNLNSATLLVEGDISEHGPREAVVQDVVNWSEGGLASLVLNAAGGLEKGKPENYGYTVNCESQVELTRSLLPIMLPNSTIVYVTSHWAHLYGQVELPPFDYEPVASSKHAGEKALRELMPMLSEREVRLIVVTGGLVTGTIIGLVGERNFPEFASQQAEIGNVITVEDMGIQVANAASNPELPSGSTIVVGAPLEKLIETSGI
jgi:NAD(P)-dependent dehydrogenase (short-subunit alcohol dehydrogenase family)